MNIRESKIEDVEQIKALCKKYGLEISREAKVIVAENNYGKITGFIAIRPVIFIEPMICENPIASVKLWKYVKDKLTDGGVGITRIFIKKKYYNLLKKLGFKRIFNKEIPMEINLSN